MSRPPRVAWIAAFGALLLSTVALSNKAVAQDSDSLEAINKDYMRDLAALEKKRLDRLEKLAASSKGEAATDAYVAFFQTALSGGNYADAEAVAERIIGAGKIDSRVLYMAEITNILAELDRGDYEGSLKSLTAAARAARQEDQDHRPVALVLPQHTRLSIVDTYYQKLVQAGKFDIAQKALKLISENSPDPAVREFAASRLARIELIGKPAPALVGTDLDGKAFKLADAKGDVVLVVFWATWCVPCGAEAEMLDQVYDTYRGKGLRIVGVNVDALSADGASTDEVGRDVRRFLVEHNVRFPNLISGTGDADLAKAYGVKELPASFVVDREGRISQVDVTPANVDEAVTAALGGK